MAPQYDYDVAFSFAGEDRRVVEPIAGRLKQQNVSVFYDRDKQAAIWGENLQEYLTEVYLKQARFCVMFISQAYAEKMWTRQERRAAMARALEQKRPYILPIRLDNSELQGLLPSVAYINISDYTEDQIVALILEKLDADAKTERKVVAPTPAFNIAMPKIKKTFTQREKDVFARQAFEIIREYFEQALQQLKAHDSDVDVEFETVHRSKFLCHAYVKGEPMNRCKIWLGTWTHQASDDHICYFEGRNVSRDQDNSTTDLFFVESDGHKLGLEPTSGLAFRGMRLGEEGRLLTAERASEMLWQQFTKRFSAE